MSLIKNAMTACVRLIETDGTRSDGMGGVLPVWSEGARFEAALVRDENGEGRTADQARARAVYSVLTGRGVCLEYHDVFRRLSDGAVFRVVAGGTDSQTPPGAGLDLRRARAERWALP